MNIQKKIQKELVKIRKRRVEIMNDEIEIRQRCYMCDVIIMWNVVIKCEECRIIESSYNENEEIVNTAEGRNG